MSQKVLFNGAVLIRPGAATKVDASGFANVALSGVGVVGLVGEADGGQPNVIKTFRTAPAVKSYYRSGPLVEGAQIALNPSNDTRITQGASLIACVKVNQSTQASLNLAGTGGITDPAGVTVTPQGTVGTTSYTYAVVAMFNGGTTAAVPATVGTGNAVLSATNFNRVSWTTIPTAQSYQIYRTASAGTPTSLGYIGAALAGATQFDDTALAGDGTTAPTTNTTGTSIVIKSKDYGSHTNQISVQVTAGGDISIRATDRGVVVTETSPLNIGDTGKFTIRYTGTGTPAALTVTSTALLTSVTGATGDNLNLVFANYKSLADVITAINATGKYTATALIYNSGQFNPANLDPSTIADIKTTSGTVYATKFDIVEWINGYSQYLEATPGGAVGPPTAVGPVYLTGGYRGIANNTRWTNALSMLGTLRVNQVVPLASADGARSENQAGTVVYDTYTLASVIAGTAAHATYYSGTAGKSERQAWIGAHYTKSQAILAANTYNSPDLCLLNQQLLLPSADDGNMMYMPEWATACAVAGLRAGAPLGEPLTWKYPRAQGLKQTADWTVEADAEDMLLNGVMILENVAGRGIRVMKGITTYTRSNNDAYMEESIVQGWKNIAYEWRSALEERYVGVRGLLENISTVVPFSYTILDNLRDQGQIADSYVNGVSIPGFRGVNVELNGDILSVGGTVSPVSGVNYVLNTIYVVPAKISL